MPKIRIHTSMGLTPFQCVLGYQLPLFPWSDEPSDVPAMDDWAHSSQESSLRRPVPYLPPNLVTYRLQLLPSTSPRHDDPSMTNEPPPPQDINGAPAYQ
ncbi:hypothetical protein QTP70_025661, partial [Hemibagrus guttatus]